MLGDMLALRPIVEYHQHRNNSVSLNRQSKSWCWVWNHLWCIPNCTKPPIFRQMNSVSFASPHYSLSIENMSLYQYKELKPRRLFNLKWYPNFFSQLLFVWCYYATACWTSRFGNKASVCTVKIAESLVLSLPSDNSSNKMESQVVFSPLRTNGHPFLRALGWVLSRLSQSGTVPEKTSSKNGIFPRHFLLLPGRESNTWKRIDCWYVSPLCRERVKQSRMTSFQRPLQEGLLRSAGNGVHRYDRNTNIIHKCLRVPVWDCKFLVMFQENVTVDWKTLM